MQIENPVLYEIWKDRYCKNNETIDENIHRVAKHCAKTPQEEEDFYKVMNEGLFFPAGRTMSNAGIGKDLTLNNCFVAPQIKDDLADIFNKVSLGACTHQKGGGIGYDFSQIRPKGTPTSNDAIASGAISFMDVFNAQTATILQGNRRGANMGVMSIYNMDIEDFINAKSQDANSLAHFNVTVMIDNDFMIAKNKNEDIWLHYPVYGENGKLLKDETKWKYKKKVNAQYLWDMIIAQAYNNGEPGIFFYENMNEDNNLWYIENIVCSNPCFTGDMKLLTSEGYKTFKELEGESFQLININGDKTKGKVWYTGSKETVIIRFANNKTIECTPDHRFMTIDGDECFAKDLKGKKVMPIHTYKHEFDNFYIKLGFIQGDGQLTRLLSSQHKGLEVNIGYKDGDILELFKDEDFTIQGDNRSIYLRGFNNDLNRLGFSKEVLPNRLFPIAFSEWDINKKSSFLQGCYSANGSVIKAGRVSYKTTCREFAEQLVEELKDNFDISSYITTNKPSLTNFSNGEYICKESYDINIASFEDIQKFLVNIGFYQQYKKIQLSNMLKEKTPKVTSVIKGHVKRVYDFNEPETHWGVVEGFIAHNCAEYIAGTIYGDNPLTGDKINPEEYGGACNLGSLILHNFVENPFTKNAYINYAKLDYAISIGVRFLDNIIDINKFPHIIYENYQKAFRTIGLGVTSLGDTLAMLGLKYNSEKALHFTDVLMERIALTAYRHSIELAKEKGEFPFLDREKFTQSGYLQKHKESNPSEWQKIIEDIEKYGIRNSKILSIAPTGTMSLTFGSNCSSGIEPIFSLSYDRKVKVGGQSDSDIQIVKMEDYAYKLWKETTENNVVPEDIFVTAMNLSVDDHIKMLEKIAYHVDMSVSKTINVPTDYSFEETKEIYDKCWEAGVKGCTIFRPNEIRQGVLITETPKEDDIKEEIKSNILDWGTTIQASDELVGRKRKIMSGCGSLHLQAWYDSDTGKLLEIFLSKGSNGGCNSFMTGLSRSISLALRTGASFDYAIDQLKSVPACPSYVARSATKNDCSKGNSCPSAIANSLVEIQRDIDFQLGLNELGIINSSLVFESDNTLNKEERDYLLKNGEIAFSKKYQKCPSCSDGLDSVDGCLQCRDCGWSKCG